MTVGMWALCINVVYERVAIDVEKTCAHEPLHVKKNSNNAVCVELLMGKLSNTICAINNQYQMSIYRRFRMPFITAILTHRTIIIFFFFTTENLTYYNETHQMNRPTLT
jgi:hypothetical protein